MADFEKIKELYKKYAKRRITLIKRNKMERSRIKKDLRNDGFTDIADYDNFDEAWQKLQLSTTSIIIFSVVTQDGLDFLHELIDSTRFKQTPMLIFSNRIKEHTKIFANSEIVPMWIEAPINTLKIEEGLAVILAKGIIERSQIAEESTALDHFTKAMDAIASEDYEQAKELLRLALKGNPDFFEAYIKMGEVLIALRQLDAAERVAQRAIDMRPDDPKSLLLRSLVASEIKSKEDAVQVFDYSVSKRPRDSVFVIEIGNLALKKGWIDDAIRYFEMAREIDPDLIHVYNRLGIAYSRAGNFDSAMKMYELALGIDENDAGIHFNVAMTYYRMGDEEKSLQSFRKSNQLDPELEEPLQWIKKLESHAK